MNEIKHYHFGQITTTNDYAKELLHKEQFVAVTADYQWNGHGRNNKKWHGNPGENIYCSIGIKHTQQKTIEELIAYQASGCLAALTTIKEVAENLILKLKYPNDILIRTSENATKKICGILVEHEFSGTECQSTIIGIGINVHQRIFPKDISATSTSLALEGYNVHIENVTHRLIEHITKILNKNVREVIAEWRSTLKIVGNIVEILGKGKGWKITRMLQDGRLEAKNMYTNEECFISDGDSIRYEY